MSLATPRKGVFSTKDFSLTVVFTALTCAATMIFTVYVPVTKGYFNIGETMVYTSALLFGPFIGAVTGGVGSMLADIFLGYYYFAPATLVIKGIEAFIVGFLSQRTPFKNPTQWKIFTVIMGLSVGAIVWIVGTSIYSGLVETTVGLPLIGTSTITFELPTIFWSVLAFCTFLSIMILGLKVDYTLGWTVLSILIGGLLMVLGYFLYEEFFLGYYALAEVPVNIGQASVGLLISIPLAKAVKRVLRYRI